MIATSKSLPPRPPRPPRAVPAVDDPRRSYDRGVWSGAETEASAEAGGAAPDLAGISLDALRRELDRRQKGLQALIAKRAHLAQELAALDAQLAVLQGTDRASRATRTPPGGRGGPARLALPRQKNSISLPDAVALEAEVGQIVTPPEIARRVLASGYQTQSKTFTAMITNVLSKDARFRRVGRGRYERVGA